MRRLRVEWLILPLVLLPLAVAGTLCLLARSAYRAQVAPLRADGRAAVERRLAETDGGALRLRFLNALGDAEAPAGMSAVPVTLSGREADVWVADGAADEARWMFSDVLPGGLPAAALADARVRLDIETGRTPVELEAAPAAARRFASLLATPDLAALRDAPLPASTKAYVVRRWLRAHPHREEWQRARHVLELVADVAPLPAQVRSDDALGVFAGRRAELIARGPDAPVCIAPAGTTSHFVRAQVLPLTEDSEIVWTPRGTLAQSVRDHAVWSGQIDTPLAGTWSLLLPYGDAWWRSALFTRWFPVAAALLLLLLAVPVLLLISIRRRARLDEARARFLNEIAHDLRTPLTSLRLYADMLAGDDVERTARTRYAGVIARESARLTALLANLLDLSRLEGGKRLYDVQDVAVSSAVSGAVADFGALYPGRAGDVTCEGGDDVVARADPTGLARCLGNLLDNAGKFTEPGTPIRVKWSREGGEVRVAVADDGPGVPEDERRSIFERYSRGDRAQQDGIQGTGLGLSLVRELVQGMGGSIELVDAPGAAFVLRLSAAPTEDGRAPERAPATTGGERA